jgi:hypothetical protein
MIRVNEFQFYELAISIHPLTTIDDESKYSDVWLDLNRSAQTLNQLFQERSLEFCFAAASELYGAVGNVVPHDFGKAIEKLTDRGDPESPLGWGAVQPIRLAASKFETILAAELNNSDTYWISPKGTHKTSMLLKSAHSMLPGAIAEHVPGAAMDFDEAGRCWLLDAYTAAGFHLMRATDSVMRAYYRAAIGIEPKMKFRNWGAYIKEFRKCAVADQKIIDFLAQVKENYRNPILHPELNLTADDAQILFGVSVSAISMMVRGIQELSVKGGTLPLTQTPILPGLI